MSYNITLSSNVCLGTFINTPSQYITRLPRPLELDGQWVVGLTEIHIPYTWYNVMPTNNRLYIADIPEEVQPQKKFRSSLYPCDLKPGYYGTPQELVEKASNCIN